MEQKQADVNSLVLLLGLLCHLLPLMFKYAVSGGYYSVATSTLQLSRASSILMLLAYVAYIFFQLKTHRQLFDSQEVIHLFTIYAMICQNMSLEKLYFF